jgi:hypothetical protein
VIDDDIVGAIAPDRDLLGIPLKLAELAFLALDQQFGSGRSVHAGIPPDSFESVLALWYNRVSAPDYTIRAVKIPP